ncbi:MAG: hypothetical protein ACYS4T_20255 [Planctomycetota bacterium]|jgi:hypothetical protein
MEPDKKIAAAISAVMSHIKTEEEIIYQQAMAAPAEAQTPAGIPTKMWALSGRQAIMQMRHLMQLKTFR